MSHPQPANPGSDGGSTGSAVCLPLGQGLVGCVTIKRRAETPLGSLLSFLTRRRKEYADYTTGGLTFCKGAYDLGRISPVRSEGDDRSEM